ncbi:MAG: Sir2 family NAD-dependent protein deacetylase, partial [Alphaproteobacteria bacterium]
MLNFLKNIFILTGAGISSESGIKTFREKDGLWDNYRIEDVCTPEAFQRNPDKVNNFYNERKVAFNGPDIKPNNGHKALVELEGICKKDFLIVTQNIDSLHEKAGSKNLLHMHGSLERLYCMY